jgi:DNA-binding MarR family transcriptional regulator
VTRSTASAIIERLVRRNLVSRMAHPQERRSVVLTLTQAGAEHHQQAREATSAQMAKVIAAMSETDLRRVRDGFALLGDAFREILA